MTYLSRNVVLAAGATTLFAVPFPYLSKDHVKVSLNGEAVPFSWTSDNILSITPAPVGTVLVKRETSPTLRLVDFTDSSRVNAEILDESALQLFYLAQESLDTQLELGDSLDDLKENLANSLAALLEPYYTKTEIDAKISGFVTAGDLASALSGLVSSQSLASTLSAYALKTSVYTKSQVYTKDEIDYKISQIPTVGPGGDGSDGAPGKSAYQIWLDAGNSGTEADFLASLKGAPGVAGTDGLQGDEGLSAYEVWLNAGHTGSEAEFLTSLVGPAGQRGLQGIQGDKGDKGDPGPAGSGGGLTNSVIFKPAAGATSFTTYTLIVPANVYKLLIELWGAGASGTTGPDYGGGGGAYILGELAVAPGDVLTVYVGFPNVKTADIQGFGKLGSTVIHLNGAAGSNNSGTVFIADGGGNTYTYAGGNTYIANMAAVSNVIDIGGGYGGPSAGGAAPRGGSGGVPYWKRGLFPGGGALGVDSVNTHPAGGMAIVKY